MTVALSVGRHLVNRRNKSWSSLFSLLRRKSLSTCYRITFLFLQSLSSETSVLDSQNDNPMTKKRGLGTSSHSSTRLFPVQILCAFLSTKPQGVLQAGSPVVFRVQAWSAGHEDENTGRAVLLIRVLARLGQQARPRFRRLSRTRVATHEVPLVLFSFIRYASVLKNFPSGCCELLMPAANVAGSPVAACFLLRLGQRVVDALMLESGVGDHLVELCAGAGSWLRRNCCGAYSCRPFKRLRCIGYRDNGVGECGTRIERENSRR